MKKDEIRRIAKIHDYLRETVRVSENEKALLVAGVSLCLWHRGPSFLEALSSLPSSADAGAFVLSEVGEALKTTPDFVASDVSLAFGQFSFIASHPELKKAGVFQTLAGLVSSFSVSSGVFSSDALGSFYSDFMKYASGDRKSLGIVLTPPHVAGFMAKLGGVDGSSVVLDSCAGTGALLLGALRQMPPGSGSCLVGVESSPQMHALLVSGLLMSGASGSRLLRADCFDPSLDLVSVDGRRPTVGLLNPPYSQRGPGVSEADFILRLLSAVEVGGVVVAIVPHSVCAGVGRNSRRLRDALLAGHTLEAVFSMPDDLFYPVGVTTAVLVIRAGVPHDKSRPTFFAYCVDDGFLKTKNQGRCDYRGLWSGIEAFWLSAFRSGSEVPGFSVLRCVTAEDEWSADAFLSPDFSDLTPSEFVSFCSRLTAGAAALGVFSNVENFRPL